MKFFKREDVVSKAKEGKWYSLPEAEGIVDGVEFNVNMWNAHSFLNNYGVSACRDPDGDNKHCETEYFNTYSGAKNYFDELVRKYSLEELPRERYW